MVNPATAVAHTRQVASRRDDACGGDALGDRESQPGLAARPGAERATGSGPVGSAEVGLDNPLVAVGSDLGARPRRLWWKRPMDLLVIFLSLPVTVPVMLLVAALIKLVSPGPILFVQIRIGHQGRSFRCLKFRTMAASAEQDSHRDHAADLISGDAPMTKLDRFDARVIPMGRILRASGMDELPQFLNVLRGEMSLIGPRPCTRYELRRYSTTHLERFQALPGITGLWQVRGKNRTTFSEMMRLDIHYARHASFALDCEILARTSGVILEGALDSLRHRSGASHQRRASVPSISRP